jgi:hypothetical protein
MEGRRALNIPLLRRLLAAVGFLSAAVMVAAGATGLTLLVSAAAAGFALAVALVAVASNFEIWRRGPASDVRVNALRAYGSLRRNGLICALAYGWGAVAMQAVYLTPLTGLRWQHAWQYALAMALLAAGAVAFVRSLPLPVPRARAGASHKRFRLAVPLALAQALLAAGGLAFLAVSGKLASARADWAANRVFAALAVAILAVSMATVVSMKRTEPHA